MSQRSQSVLPAHAPAVLRTARGFGRGWRALLLIGLIAGVIRAATADVQTRMLVSTHWLAQHLNDSRVIVLHVAREHAHYDAAHLPGARFVAWGELVAIRRGVPNELPPAPDLQRLFERLGIGNEGRIVLYGDQSGLSAARAYFTLDYLGHGHRVALLDGGLEKWKAEGRVASPETPVVTPAPGSGPSVFAPRLRPEVAVSLDAVRDLSWAAAHLTPLGATLIDARPAEEFAGTKPGEGVSRPGHIPGAANLFWVETLVSREEPVLRPAAELRRLFERAGAAPGRILVAYCRTGAQSSHTYFVAKYLGYDVTMYDGSFIEWSNLTDTEVRKR
jgi:thiosulfate/3-mercaptopyruvate sulfurtransferase